MATLADLSDSDLLALKAGDLSKLSDDGLASLKAMRSAPAPKASGPVEGVMPDDAEFRPYKPGLADRITNSAVVRGLSKILGPTDQQRLEQSSDAFGREQQGLAPREQTLDEKGLIPAIMKSAATPVRVAGGIAGSPGGVYGAGANALAEGAAQLMEGRIDPGRVGQAAAIGIPTLGSTTGVLAGAMKTGVAAAIGEAIRQALNGQEMNSGAIGADAAVSGGLSAAMGALTRGGARAVGASEYVTDGTSRGNLAAELRKKGFMIPDSDSYPDRVLRGIAGKTAVEDATSRINSTFSDDIAKAANKTSDLGADSLAKVRIEAGKRGYEPLRAAGSIATDPAFTKALDDIASTQTRAARSFPGAGGNQIADVLAPLRVSSFDAGDALDQIRLLREQSTAAYSSATPNRQLGAAYKQAANAIEDQIERGLAGRGQAGAEMLSNYRTARQDIARSASTGEAVREGGNTIIPAKLGQMVQAEKPLSGGLEDVGAMANNFSKFAKDPATIAQPGVSKIQAALAGLLGAGAWGKTSDPRAAIAAAMLAYTPDAARAAVTSRPYQNLIQKQATPNSQVVQILQRLGANATADSEQIPPAVQAILNRLSAPSP